LSAVHINWTGADVEKSAGCQPAIFSGDVVRFAARCKKGGKPSTNAAVSLTAQYNDLSLEWKPSTVSDAATEVPALWWAKQRIQELERVDVSAGSRQQRRLAKKQNAEIIELSKAYGIICSLTSLIGVEERNAAAKNNGKPELRRIPVMIPAGRDFIQAGGGGVLYCLTSAASCLRMPGVRESRGIIERLENMCTSVTDFFSKTPSKSAFTETDEIDGGFNHSPAGSAAPSGTDGSEDLLVKILMHASASGMFAYSRELLDLMKATEEEFAEFLAKIPTSLFEDERRDKAMTLLVRHKLETDFSAQKAMWSAIASKIDRNI
jgi:hypothetical protein